MSENMEQLQNNQEHSAEKLKSSAEQLEKLRDKQESSAELSPRDIESRTEKARIEALENALSVESGGKEKDGKPKHQTPVRRNQISKKQLENSYKQTIKQVQTELSPSRRAFSKIIHNNTVEKTSEIVGGTIARPNAILVGSIFAFILTLLAYTVAKTIGYKLSGFETIAAFIVGWVIGIIYDYFVVLFTGKK